MSSHRIALLVAVGLAGVGVFGDYLLKLASDDAQSVRTRWFWAGLLVYAAMAAGWVYVMRHLSFAEIGVVYSVSTVLLLTLVGTIVLGEPLRRHEVLGAGMAITSLCLLARFG